MIVVGQIFLVVLFFSWIGVAITVLQVFRSGRSVSSLSNKFALMFCVAVGPSLLIGFPSIFFLPQSHPLTLIILGLCAVSASFSAVTLWYDDTYRRPRREIANNKKVDTQQTSSVRQLDDARRRLRNLVEIGGDWIWQTDAGGRLIDVSEGIRDSLGDGPEFFVGKTLDQISTLDPSSNEWIALQKTLSNKERFRNFTFSYRTKVGETKWVRLSGSPWHDDRGEFRGYHGLGSDLTAEMELQSARATSRAKDGFIASVSHELRTPLNGVLGILEIISETDLNSDQRKLISTGLSSGQSLLYLINDILDFSKMQAGHLELDPHSEKISTLVSKTVSTLNPLAQKNRNQLIFQVPDTISDNVLIDGQRFQQILVNLVGNAIKFTRRGRIEINAKLVDANKQSQVVRFEVSDTGPGIPNEKKGKLFKEFSMLHNPGKTRIEGTGLGLALCKKLVEAMGGEIGVESEAGVGSTFWFELELQATREPPQSHAKVRLDSSKNETRLNRDAKILLAEDNPTNAVVTTRMLQPTGVSIKHVENGLKAVDAFEKGAFDVILMDVSMPEMDGITATQRIRQIEKERALAAIPIIALTAHVVAKDREHMMANGMSSHLSKPIRKADLKNELHNYIPEHDDIKLPEQTLRTGPDTKAPETKRLKGADKSRRKSGVDKAAKAQSSLAKKLTSPLDLQKLQILADETGPDALQSLVKLFKNEIRARALQLNTAKKTKNLELLKTTCHAIAGSSATIGATRIEHLCKRTERACAARKSVQHLHVVDTITREIDVFLPHLDKAATEITAR